VALVGELGQASISLVQRYMKIGYNRAARIIEKWKPKALSVHPMVQNQKSSD